MPLGHVVRRAVALLAVLVAPVLLVAVPHAFSSGQVADAQKVNENFLSLETRATVRWQKKTMSANVSTQGARTELDFANLDTTKTYRLTVATQVFGSGVGGLVYSTGGNELVRVVTHPGAIDGTVGNSIVFRATHATLVATVLSTGGAIVSAGLTYGILEELNGHEMVTAF